MLANSEEKWIVCAYIASYTVCTGIMVGHVSPEAFCGGNIALVQNGDVVTINPTNKTLDVVRLHCTTNNAML